MTGPNDQTQQLRAVPPRPARSPWRRRLLIGAGAVVGLFVVLAVVGAIVGPPPPEPEPAALPAAETSAPAPEPVAPPVVDAPPAVAPAPAAPPPAAAPVRFRADDLTEAQRVSFTEALLDEVPTIQARVDRSGSVRAASEYVANDGALVCERIAGGEADDVVLRYTAGRFEIPEAEAATAREVTERELCPLF